MKSACRYAAISVVTLVAIRLCLTATSTPSCAQNLPLSASNTTVSSASKYNTNSNFEERFINGRVRRGSMTAYEAKKLLEVGAKLHDTHKLSNADISFLVNMVESPPPIAAERSRIERIVLTWGNLDPSFWSGPKWQHDQIYSVMVSLMKDKSAHVRACGVISTGCIRDKRLLAYLNPLLNDPSPEVRKWVPSAIDKQRYLAAHPLLVLRPEQIHPKQ